jgi:glycosyltransferase involved in cell wall biosynthesis
MIHAYCFNRSERQDLRERERKRWKGGIMKVCVVQNVSMTNHLALSTYLRNLVEALAGTGKIRVTAIVSEGYVNDIQKDNIEVMASGTDLYSLFGNLRFIFWALLALWKSGRRRPIDVIHCLYPSSSTLACVLYKWLISPRTCVIYDIRSPWIDMSTRRGIIKSWMKSSFRTSALILEETILNLVDGAVFITDGLEKHYRSIGLIPPINCTISPSGVDVIAFHPTHKGAIRKRLNLEDGDKIIGYVGGVAKTRQLSFVLDGFEKLLEKDNGTWNLVFIGDGDDLAHLKSEVARRSLNRVHFLGKVQHKEVANLIGDLDYGVCHLPETPLFNTSFPMKVLEYLACGKPVLMSNMPAHVELAKQLSGTVIYDFSPLSFAESVIESAPNVKVDLKDVRKYSWKAIAKHLNAFYQSLVIHRFMS